MKCKRILLLLAVVLVLAMLPIQALATEAEVTLEGTCGDNAYWRFEDSTLAIYGTGAIYDYYGFDAFGNGIYPWASHAKEITEIMIEEGITYIGMANFWHMDKLTSVSLPDTLKFIGNFAFMGCTALETVELPCGLTGIGQQAFCESDLKSVEIPASVIFLDACAFENCRSLADVLICSDPNIPSFMMGNSVFRNCFSLEEIRVEEGHLALRSIDGALYFEWEDGTKDLDSYPTGKKDTELRIAENTVSIGKFAVENNPYLETVIIPASVQSIRSDAFARCSSLKTLYFEGSAPVVDTCVFLNCDVTLHYPSGDETWTEAQNTWDIETVFGLDGSVIWEAYAPIEGTCGDNAYWRFANGTLTIYGSGAIYDYYPNDVLIPTPWENLRNEITTLVIEEGITEIGPMAFGGLPGLTAVSLPDSLIFIGNFAFMDCTVLEAVELPCGLTGIGQEAFCRSGLKFVEIPASVTFLDAGVFDSCRSLTDVLFRSDPNIPSFMMGNSVLENCTSLEKIRVEEGHLALRSIDGVLYFQWDDGSMYLNTYPAGKKETELRVADNTVYIGQMSARNNPYLETVIFPATVEFIENAAFMSCDALKTLIFEGSAPTVQPNIFWGAQATLYYPCGDETWEEARNTWNTESLVGRRGSLAWEMRHTDFEEDVVAPTCTEPGYTTHTCTKCGYTYADGHVDAAGHSFGDWVVLQEPVNGASGLRERTCATCGHTETEVIPWCFGDANGDSEVNGKDLILLRQSLAGWDVEMDETAADCNGDGEVNGKDLILLRQYLAGWDVELG